MKLQTILISVSLMLMSCVAEPEEEDCLGVVGGNAVIDFCGVCDGDDTSCYGCIDINACNFNPDATTVDTHRLFCSDRIYYSLCSYPCQDCTNGGENCCELYDGDDWKENACQIPNYAFDCNGDCIAEYICDNECVIGHTEIGCLFEGNWFGNTSQEPTSSWDEGHGDVSFSIDKFGIIANGSAIIYFSYASHGCELSYGFREIGLNNITINSDSSFSYLSDTFEFNGNILSDTEISGTLSYLLPLSYNCNQEEIQLTWSVDKEVSHNP